MGKAWEEKKKKSHQHSGINPKAITQVSSGKGRGKLSSGQRSGFILQGGLVLLLAVQTSYGLDIPGGVSRAEP